MATATTTTTRTATNQRVRYTRGAQSPLRRAGNIGLSGGVAALLVSLVGMVPAFHARFIIGGVLTTGQALLLAIVLITGYLVARRNDEPGASRGSLLGYGALAGLMIGLLLAGLVLLGSAINMRAVLVNAAPPLFNILTFGQEYVMGSLLLLVVGALLGAAGAALYILPANVRSALITGITAVVLIGLMQDLVKLLLSSPNLRPTSRFLFARAGLTIPGALIIFAIPFFFRLASNVYGPRTRARVDALPAASRKAVNWGLMAVGFLLLLAFPTIFGRFPTEVINNVMMLGILLGLGLNIVVGFAGLLDLGHVGFFAIGAYTIAIFTSPEMAHLGLPQLTFWQALPIALFMSIFAGVVLGIPVLKMRGDYLAIVTLGFGEIIRLLLLSDAMRGWVGGARGIVQIPNASVAGRALGQPELLFYMILAAVILMWFISRRLRDSYIGRAWMAVREDEDVAAAMGINLVNYKLMAFGCGAAMAGLGGAIFASKLQSIVPQSFNLLISINALAIIIIGGMASIPGVVVGALLLVGLPELLREFNDDLPP
jgi:branched-chain amino acid transport system permease protein